MAPPPFDLGRFAEPGLLILISLTEGPKHGYAIMTELEGETGKAMGPGTLYAALARLEDRGLIEALPPIERRRPYRITAVGAKVLTERLHDLDRVIRKGLGRLGEDAR